MWLAAYFAGKGVLKLLRYHPQIPPELAIAAGVIVFSLAAFGLAAVHLAYGFVVKAVVIAVLALGFYPWVRRLRAAPTRARRWLAELEPGPAAWIFCAGLLAFPLVLAAAQPPLYWDALTYHLAVPHKYALAHGIVYLPYNTYSSMPLGATMFYLWGMLWDGLTCANASYFAASLVVVALVYRLARFWLPQFYAAAAGFLVLFSPVFFVVMPGAHVDHFLMLYVVAALYAYFLPRPAGDAMPPRRAWAVGIFLGAALAVKYTSIYVLGAFAPIFVYDLVRRRLRWRDAAVILAVACSLRRTSSGATPCSRFFTTFWEAATSRKCRRNTSSRGSTAWGRAGTGTITCCCRTAFRLGRISITNISRVCICRTCCRWP
jgi:hypothetical protein